MKVPSGMKCFKGENEYMNMRKGKANYLHDELDNQNRTTSKANHLLDGLDNL
jgi:hypothetical protein